MSDEEFGVPDAPPSNELIGAAILVAAATGLIVGAVVALIAVAVF